MTVRRLPLHPFRQQQRWNTSMMPGTVQGRLASAAPLRQRNVLARLAQQSVVIGNTWWQDHLTATASGQTQLTLGAVPVPNTLIVWKNYVKLPFTSVAIAGQTVTLGTTIASGDVIETEYEVLSGTPSAGSLSAPAITLVQHTTTTGTGASGSVTLPGAVASGDALILFVANFEKGVNSVSGCGATWTRQSPQLGGPGTGREFECWVGIGATSSGAVTITFAASTVGWCAALSEWAHVAAVRSGANASNTNATADTSSLIPVVGDLVIGGHDLASTSVTVSSYTDFPTGEPWTLLDTVQTAPGTQTLLVSYRIATSTSLHERYANLSATAAWSGIINALHS